jgi:phospholipid transport system substrate-binding protein
VVVNCEATDRAHPNNAPYKVAFRIRKASDGRFVITDLNLEGVWQTLSQRADFTGFLQQHGGKLQELTVSSGLILPQSHRFEFPILARAGAVD